jgi:hypothetical protein
MSQQSGYFTVASKITSSLYRCAKDTILGVVAGCIILGILLGQKIVPNSAAALQLAAVIVTNTIYETMLMFLLGYGLVEFPRSLWNMSDIDYFLRKLQMKASSDYKAISDAQLEVSLAVSDVIKTREAVRVNFLRRRSPTSMILIVLLSLFDEWNTILAVPSLYFALICCFLVP